MIASDLRVIDTDTHISEQPDLWTSRLPAKWADQVPHVRYDPDFGEDRWLVAGKWAYPVGFFAMAGWKAPTPSHPLTLDEADPGTYDPVVRLQRMDEYGIYAQLLYPNVVSHSLGLFLEMEPEVSLACIRAYNDFQTEFASVDPDRLLPLTVLPVWDLEATVAEMERCKQAGHRGVLFVGKFEQAGMPHFTSSHWDRFYAAAQDLELSINFHAGAGVTINRELDADAALIAERHKANSAKHGKAVRGSRDRARSTAMGLWPALAETISHIVTSGLCDRFPTAKFVSVESGFGYLPYLLESLDWHWKNYGVPADAPGSLLPSEYFRRQVYATFWFERDTLSMLELYQDNIMFETDYPHPTSLSPGPYSAAENPAVHIEKAFKGLPPAVTRKVLHDNAAALYRVP